MKVCGFSFLKNAVKFDYPAAEAIRSILPVCDHFIVAVGDCDDGTAEMVRNIDPKVQVIRTVWDEGFREGGRVLALETDKAFQAILRNTTGAFTYRAMKLFTNSICPPFAKQWKITWRIPKLRDCFSSIFTSSVLTIMLDKPTHGTVVRSGS
ncbi:MAG: hypothetical protein WDO15_10740 [Bacteroidota bacterium]